MGVTEFRRAVLADAGAVAALTRDAYAPWVQVIGREPLPMTVDYADAVLAHRIDLLHQDGALVALIEMLPHSDHLWIENVAVSPDHQGRGLGRVLIGHAEAVARNLGTPDLRLLTNAAFAVNLQFYARLGFTEERSEPFRGGTTVYFRKGLTG